jgi:hypothetical protein
MGLLGILAALRLLISLPYRGWSMLVLVLSRYGYLSNLRTTHRRVISNPIEQNLCNHRRLPDDLTLALLGFAVWNALCQSAKRTGDGLTKLTSRPTLLTTHNIGAVEGEARLQRR